MTQFFRSGIYEYDKRPARNVKKCESCGADIDGRAGKRFCLPCYDVRLQANIAAGRLRRKNNRTRRT